MAHRTFGRTRTEEVRAARKRSLAAVLGRPLRLPHPVDRAPDRVSKVGAQDCKQFSAHVNRGARPIPSLATKPKRILGYEAKQATPDALRIRRQVNGLDLKHAALNRQGMVEYLRNRWIKQYALDGPRIHLSALYRVEIGTSASDTYNHPLGLTKTS